MSDMTRYTIRARSQGVLWPGKPTTNTVWTAVEDYTWFEAFSEEGCATGISCTPALHMQSERKTIDERGEG